MAKTSRYLKNIFKAVRCILCRTETDSQETQSLGSPQLSEFSQSSGSSESDSSSTESPTQAVQAGEPKSTLESSESSTTAPILRLPPEILLHVEKFLKDEDSLAYRASHWRMRYMNSRLPLVLYSLRGVQEMAIRLRWDNVCRFVEAENPESTLLFCAFCNEVHPPEEFLRDQLCNNAWNRVCLRQRVYRLCEHLNLGYHRMRALRDGGPGTACLPCAEQAAGPLIEFRQRHGYGHILSRAGDEITHTCKYIVPDIDSRLWQPLDRMRDQLAALRTPICPHVRFCDVTLRDGLSGPATLAVQTYDQGRVEGRCNNPACNAAFTFR
ncbi:hypothetical protein IWX49DRAFT_599842 [Phyllosticta citricarpa]|uniref:F-box domain-containing protein n=2 Tax=Phyllosticta TaxID=121621 RepID=A0ABR1MNC1_9PEZI